MKMRRTHSWLRSRRTEMHDRPSRELARQWDARDKLARFRKQFSRPAGQIYLQGGSLGLCSQPAERALLRALADVEGEGARRSGDDRLPWARRSAAGSARTARRFAGTDRARASIAPGSSNCSARSTAGNFIVPYPARCFLRRCLFPPCRAIRAARARCSASCGSRVLTNRGCSMEGAIGPLCRDPTLQIAFLPGRAGYRPAARRRAPGPRSRGRPACFSASISRHSLGVSRTSWRNGSVDFAARDMDFSPMAAQARLAGLFLNRRHFRSRRANAAPGPTSMEPNDGRRGRIVLRIGAPPLLSLAPLEDRFVYSRKRARSGCAASRSIYAISPLHHRGADPHAGPAHSARGRSAGRTSRALSSGSRGDLPRAAEARVSADHCEAG